MKPVSIKGGSKDKPQTQGVNVTFTGGTKSGSGQPSNTTAIKFGLPKEWTFGLKNWPASEQCDPVKAEADRSQRPSGSKVGSGQSIAKAANGAITQNSRSRRSSSRVETSASSSRARLPSRSHRC